MSGSTVLHSSPTPVAKLSVGDRVMIIAGFVLTGFAGAYFNFLAEDRAAECQAVRSQRAADVERFRSAAAEFEPLVAAYMGNALHGKNASAAKKALEVNLRQQRARLAYVRPHLDQQGKITADRFSTSVVNFLVETEKNPTGVELGPAYQELNYIFKNSQDLIAASNRATGMENIHVTGGRYWKRTINCAEV